MPGAESLLAVLAGGRGERLGGAKAAAVLGGRPLIEWVLDAARASGLATVVIAKASTQLPRVDCEVVLEPEAPQHPLSGLISALRHAEEVNARGVVAVACDMPFLTGPLLAWLAEPRPPRGQRALVARVGGRMQPLLARYLPEQRPELDEALPAELSLTEAVRRLDPALVDERELARFGDPARLCFSVNDRADLRAAEELLAAQR
jgi:molybdopterin-guanine dinucleotide biosynthesis protein A